MTEQPIFITLAKLQIRRLVDRNDLGNRAIYPNAFCMFVFLYFCSGNEFLYLRCGVMLI